MGIWDCQHNYVANTMWVSYSMAYIMFYTNACILHAFIALSMCGITMRQSACDLIQIYTRSSVGHFERGEVDSYLHVDSMVTLALISMQYSLCHKCGWNYYCYSLLHFTLAIPFVHNLELCIYYSAETKTYRQPFLKEVYIFLTYSYFRIPIQIPTL